jgi:hypothetical protein
MITLPSTTMHIGAMLSRQHAKEMADNRNMLIKILSCVKFLARQALALRGDGDETDSNFLQLLRFLGDDALVLDWLKRKQNKYTSHEIQNELLKIMARVLRNVTDHLKKSPFLSIMVDETTDVSNQEQVTIVMRRVDEDLEVYEEFLGLYQVASIGADSCSCYKGYHDKVKSVYE